MTNEPAAPADAARLAEVVARVPGWAGRARDLGHLHGGITNRNHLVEVDGARYVVRLPGVDTELLEIDRDCEEVAARRAAGLGIAPQVVGRFAGCLVTEFVPGSSVSDADFASAATLAAIAEMLREVHALPAVDHVFNCFRVTSAHRDAAASRGVAIPAAYDRIDRIVREIATAFAVDPEAPVLCHNDLLRANFLSDTSRLWLLDWEYAGMNDRSFDLGNLAVNNALPDDAMTHLTHAYRRRAAESDVARVRLMRVVSDAREAMWGVVQLGISTLDFDYASYTADHIDRLLSAATTAAHRRDLELVAEGRA